MENLKKYYCSNCRKLLGAQDKQCSECGCKNRDIETTAGGKIHIKGLMKIKFGPKGKKAMRIIKKGWQDSVEKNKKKFPEGVDILMEVDREKNIWRHIVRNRKTGEILHEEIEPLSEHNPKSKK